MKFDFEKQVSKYFRTAFSSACVIGVITHIYIFTNLILNHDSVWRLYFDNNHLASGRWFLKAVSEFSTRFQMPVVIGLISISMLALTAGITVEILGVKNKVCIVLTSGFVVTFPSVACIFSYMFTADAYFVALFLNAFAVHFAKKNKWWSVLIGILLITLACGIYQAFICYAIGLFVFDCIFMLLANEDSSKVIKCEIKYIFLFVAALVLYYIVLKIILAITHTSLTSYQGINGMSMRNIKGFLKGIPLAYKKFPMYFTYSTQIYKIANYALFLLNLIFIIYLLFIKKIYKDIFKMILIVILFAFMPLALNFITVLSVGAWVHMLMVYSFVLLFVFAVKIIELVLETQIKNESKGKIKFVCITTSFVLCGLLIWNNFCISNMAYLRLQVCYENSYALANRIVSRIETLDGYSPNLPVAVVGEANRKMYGGTIPAFSKYNFLTGTNDILLYSAETHIRTRTFINHYIGVRMAQPNKKKKEFLSSSEIVKDMPCYPAKDSVAIVDGVIVVKLSDGSIR